MIYPGHFEEKIGFNRIRELLQARCLSDPGKAKAHDLHFTDDPWILRKKHEEAWEMVRIYNAGEEFPLAWFPDPARYMPRLAIAGMSLEAQDFADLKKTLETLGAVIRFFRNLRPDLCPLLREKTRLVPFPKILTDRIDLIFNRQGKVRDQASPRLAEIRRELSERQARISKRVQQILREVQDEGWVPADASLTIRNGRMVIPVPAANKRRVRGFIHDESDTGKTSFIEPAEVFETNNEIVELEFEEQREILKILANLTDFIRPYSGDLGTSFDFLAHLDFLNAQARFALDTGSVKPAMAAKTQIFWYRAVHPLLLLTLRKEKRDVVPLDLELAGPNRILVISGPNAGGKSVCLKTVGLLQYMFQCGLLVPVADQSEFGLFDDIFMDIGDEQAIENDLSTYSAHLTHMRFFVKNATRHSLVLIDELGSGTEPAVGGAIAEALLEHLNNLGSYGVVTTHYTNLKHLASNLPGLINGAMGFDETQLKPLFRLETGQPGSSFAFEIASRIGLPPTILEAARQKAGKDSVSFDKLLREAGRDKRYWEGKRNEIRRSERTLRELVEKLSLENRKTEKERREILRHTRDEAREMLAGINKSIENAIRTIRESQADRDTTRQVRQELEQLKQRINDQTSSEGTKETNPTDQLVSQATQLLKAMAPPDKTPLQPDQLEKNLEEGLRIGDKVKMIGEDLAGELIELNDRNAVVAFGQLMTSVSRDRIERISQNEFREMNRGNNLRSSQKMGYNLHQKRMQFKPSIDVRGLRVHEVLPLITEFIDEAVMFDAGEVKILHGTGNGVLRQFIRDHIRQSNQVSWMGDERIELGGAGITVVRFRSQKSQDDEIPL